MDPSTHLETLYAALPLGDDELAERISDMVAQGQGQSQRSPELFKAEWELSIRSSLFDLAAKEGDALEDPNTAYYSQLNQRLDVALIFTEQKICDPPFVTILLEELIDCHTVASCERIFSWIEMRSERLTEGMIPQKGKALILLRALNDLLRRLSRAGNTTTFCGRILIFLSAVFPLGERSGVNLRGEFGPQFETVKHLGLTRETDGEDTMEVDEKDEVSKPEFFETFWGLQQPFSKPPLFGSAPSTFASFQNAVSVVLPQISEATRKERALMGSKAANTAVGKRRREDAPEALKQDYFFAKYLTSPELLKLEIADCFFRRQILCQILILLQHLQGYTEVEKKKWQGKSRATQMDFTLDATQLAWVKETWVKVMTELRATAPNGKSFGDTIATILDREKNWINWKNENCIPPLNDKQPLPVSEDEDSLNKRRKLMAEKLDAWPHEYGTEAISENWDLGYKGPGDLEEFQPPGEVRDFLKRIQLQDKRIEMRRKQLSQIAARSAPVASPALQPPSTLQAPVPVVAASAQSSISPTTVSSPARVPSPAHPSLPPKPGTLVEPKVEQPTPAIPPPIAKPVESPFKPLPAPTVKSDTQIEQAQERKQALAWLALRQGAKQYLHAFGRIGTGDIELLDKEIAKTGQASKGKDIRDRDNSPHVGYTSVPPSAPAPLAKTESMQTEVPKAEIVTGETITTPMEVDG